jgi:S1-C subfamily serine protease
VYANARRDADGNRAGTPQPVESLGELFSGTGFVVTTDGWVITNRHVVSHAEKDGLTRYTYDPVVLRWDPLLERKDDVADVVAVGRQWDLALLKIRGNGPWTPMPLSDIDAVRDAQQVLVMGWPSVDRNAPLLLHHNWNVIAAIARDAKLRPRVIRHGARTTAGNSGGPVYGLETGGVVGVHTRGYISTAHDFHDMFQHGAVPVDRVTWEFPQVFVPEAPGTPQEGRLARAAFYVQQERFGAATLECLRILAADPTEGHAHAYLYRIQRLQGEPRFAEEHFAPAVAQEASRVMAHLFAARSALEEGDVTAPARGRACCEQRAKALGQESPEIS